MTDDDYNRNDDSYISNFGYLGGNVCILIYTWNNMKGGTTRLEPAYNLNIKDLGNINK